MKKFLLLLFVLAYASISFSQKSDIGNWFIYFGNQKINKKFNWHNEVQYRNYNVAGDLEQLLLRTGIGYNITENNNNVLLGYGFIRSGVYNTLKEKSYTSEHRIFQQFITKQNIARVSILHRYRIEERFVPNDFKMRFRYFLALNIPLTKKTMTKNALYVSAYNELFINAKSPVFDRNRVYGALGYVINKDLKFELGMMRQIQEKTGRTQFQIVFYNNLPFTKD